MNYLLQVSLSMFDGEEDADNAAIAAAADAAAAAADAVEAAKAGKVKKVDSFNQDQVNAIIAADRRKLVEKYQVLEGHYQEALEDQNISKETRTQLEAKLDDLHKTYLTKEETLLNEKKKIEETLSKEASTWKEAAVRWESQFKQTLMDRTLQDAAVQHEAFNASQMITLLRPMTKVTEKMDEHGKGTGAFEVIVDLDDINSETGAHQVTRRAPSDAVKRMKELREVYGNLFKPNVVSGIGGGTAPGNTSGKVDAAKLSTAEYMRRRKENPESLGVKRTR